MLVHVPFAVVPKTSQEALRDAWSRVLEEIDSEGPQPGWSLPTRSQLLKTQGVMVISVHMDLKTTKGELWDDGFPFILEPLPFG